MSEKVIKINRDKAGQTKKVEDAKIQPDTASSQENPFDKVSARANALVVHRLNKSFKKKKVVHDISFSLDRGEILGILGPNGSGKTTTFYMITGLLRPDSGSIWLDKENITHRPIYRRARFGLSYLPQETSIFRGLTVEQNLRAILEIYLPRRDQVEDKLDELLAEFSISHLRRVPAPALSGGERRRVEIARALVREPNFILLDEPFAGIDPIALDDLYSLIAQLKKRNMGVLITDHNAREMLEMVDRAIVIHNGTILAEGAPSDIVTNKNVRRLYLGDGFSWRA